jgi:hypothetical protein
MKKFEDYTRKLSKLNGTKSYLLIFEGPTRSLLDNVTLMEENQGIKRFISKR